MEQNKQEGRKVQRSWVDSGEKEKNGKEEERYSQKEKKKKSSIHVVERKDKKKCDGE